MKLKHKHHELIKAWADGAHIEYKDTKFDKWLDANTPIWDTTTDYRIKPEKPAEKVNYDQVMYLERVISKLKVEVDNCTINQKHDHDVITKLRTELTITKRACGEANNQLYTERLNVIKLQADKAALKETIAQIHDKTYPEITTK